MFKNVPVSHTLEIAGTKITLETGLLAQQATSSVLATMGETVVLAAVVVGKTTESDYFPLQVVYEERLYASGKIKGSRFIKREGRPSENAILTGRMVDRSLRSLFDKNTRSEVQVVITVLSLDEVNPPDTLSVLAASAALKIATNSFQGPVSSVRVGQLKLEPLNILSSKIKAKIIPGVEVADLQELLGDFCNVVELGDEAEKAIFREIFDLLVAQSPEMANYLKSTYQNSNRVGKQGVLEKYTSDIELVSFPSYEMNTRSDLDLVVSGDGLNIMMVEAGADIVNEEVIGKALDKASIELAKLTQFQSEFVAKVQSELKTVSKELFVKTAEPKYLEYWQKFSSELEEILYKSGKKEDRNNYLEEFKQLHFSQIGLLKEYSTLVGTDLVSFINEKNLPETQMRSLQQIQNLIDTGSEIQKLAGNLEIALEKMVQKLVKLNVLEKQRRLDGRGLNETRKIIAQPGVLARTHGSSLFSRGETQVLNVLTLGTTRDAQTLDDMEDFEEQTKRYIHHYNFPQYSVGETGRYSGPGRREIGHGALAEKALLPVLPNIEDFPYTMRLVSECLGSNGSTSMASTCASCLSLMEGGVPIKDLVAGVAMGLMLDSESGNFQVITDILGSEDHYGDMDFKVTGTKDGITAIQLDNKIAGLTSDILKQALVQSKSARLHILDIMKEAISKPNETISKYAPSVLSLVIPIEKIGEVIGPSGKIIKGLTQKYEVEIDIDDFSGRTFIYGKDAQKSAQVLDIIQKLIKEYLPGDSVSCRVFRIENYGAFVKIDNTEKEGMIHISQLSSSRVENVTDVIKMGDNIQAKVLEINEKGQISLTLK